MKGRQYILAVLWSGLILGGAPSEPLCGQDRTADAIRVRSVAAVGLRAFLERVPAGREHAYGFVARHEFNEAEVGEPYRVFMLNEEEVLHDLPPALVPLDEWRVPVLVRGDVRVLLTVGMVGGEWRVVELGARELARELAALELRHAAAPRVVRRGILRLFRLPCDVLLMGEPDRPMEEAHMVPLASAQAVLAAAGMTSVEVLTARDGISLLGGLTARANRR